MPEPLLTKVRLERFKAAFKPEPITLGPFNVIIGPLRHDVNRASDRYFGIRDLINLRSPREQQSFEVDLGWQSGEGDEWSYDLVVEDSKGNALVRGESLKCGSDVYIETRSGARFLLDSSGRTVEVREPDRLMLGRVVDVPSAGPRSPAFLRDFWQRAVFLRLSPSVLAQGYRATRASYEPLLDEGGAALPALLNELDREQRESLVDALKEILPGVQGIEVSEAAGGHNVRVHYSLLERMPYIDRSGTSDVPVPAWMLSEGTRRITAILALLQRDPPPSLLCIEEIENGLDPWSAIAVLRHLQSAADRGVQVVLTTHSPWLLDHVPMSSIIQVRRTGGDTRYERFADRPEVQAYDPSIPAGTRYVHEAE